MKAEGQSYSHSWAPILAETDAQASVQTGGISSCSPVEVGGDVFVATCNFRGYGTIVIKEFLDPGNCASPCVVPNR